MTARRALRGRHVLAVGLALIAALLVAAPVAAADPQDTSGIQANGVEWTAIDVTGALGTSTDVDVDPGSRPGFQRVALGVEWTVQVTVPGAGVSANGVEWTQ